MTDYVREGFVRQRRNLMMMSVTLLLVESAGIKVSELNLLGNKLLIESPGLVNVGLWIALLYWIYRHYVYFHDIGDKGFVNKYRSRIMDLVYAIALKQLKRDKEKMAPLVAQGKTSLRLGGDNSFYQRSLWRCEIKLHVIATTPGVDDQNSKWLHFDHYVVSSRIPLAAAHLRAWLHVLTRTHLFSEYLLPFAVASLPVANHLRAMVGG